MKKPCKVNNLGTPYPLFIGVFFDLKMRSPQTHIGEIFEIQLIHYESAC